MSVASQEMPWLLVELNRQQFGIPAGAVRELVAGAEVNAVPGYPAYVRGVMNLRGRVIPVVDLRKRLGMPSILDETASFCDLMEQREKDHVNWLNELESSLRENREFKLATDPHKCAFGRWYYSYTADDAWIKSLLRRFEDPHSRIHETAIEVLALREQGKMEVALTLIEEKRHSVLGEMIELFRSLRDLIRETQKEIMIVLEAGQRLSAITVDKALALERFSAEEREPLPVDTAAKITQVGRKGKGQPVLLLATEALGYD